MRNTKFHFLLIILAVVLFGLSSGDLFFHFDPLSGMKENRKLAEPPNFAFDGFNIKRYITSFERYFQDNFGFRGALIRFYSLIKYFAFDQSPSDQVMIGKDHQLFYRGDNNLNTYRHLSFLSDADLRTWKDELVRRKKFTEQAGGHFIFLVAPDAHSVESALLPKWAKKKHPGTVLDEIISQTQDSIHIINLKPWLIKKKEELIGPLYFKTDTHWTSLGAYWGSVFLFQFLTSLFPQEPSFSKQEEATYQVTNGSGGDLSVMMGLQQLFSDSAVTINGFNYDFDMVSDVVELQGDIKDGKKLVLFRDSFGLGLIPFLRRGFGKMIIIKSHKFDEKVVETFKPDLVILQMVERIMSRPPRVALLMDP